MQDLGKEIRLIKREAFANQPRYNRFVQKARIVVQGDEKSISQMILPWAHAGSAGYYLDIWSGEI